MKNSLDQWEFSILTVTDPQESSIYEVRDHILFLKQTNKKSPYQSLCHGRLTEANKLT